MTRLPLPLELTKPVLLVDDLETQFRGDYDPKTQLCSETTSEQECETVDAFGVIQLDVADLQVDDILA